MVASGGRIVTDRTPALDNKKPGQPKTGRNDSLCRTYYKKAPLNNDVGSFMENLQPKTADKKENNKGTKGRPMLL